MGFGHSLTLRTLLELRLPYIFSIRTDYDEAAEEYLIHKYGFDKQEIRSKTVAASFYDEIYEHAPSYEEYSIHTITSINIRIDGEEYELEWEPSEIRGIIADLFELER